MQCSHCSAAVERLLYVTVTVHIALDPRTHTIGSVRLDKAGAKHPTFSYLLPSFARGGQARESDSTRHSSLCFALTGGRDRANFLPHLVPPPQAASIA